MKKKIRAIQYGVGPIGASIARLMREKQAIEICGAIDTDPAKVGRDLGEVVGASVAGDTINTLVNQTNGTTWIRSCGADSASPVTAVSTYPLWNTVVKNGQLTCQNVP